MDTRTLLIGSILLLSTTAAAQDSLFYSSGQMVVGRVVEIGTEDVKYMTFSDDHPVTITVKRNELDRIRLAGGQVFEMNATNRPNNGTGEARARKHAISFALFSPGLNHLSFSYEHMLAPGFSLVGRLGYIGLWKTARYNYLEDGTSGLRGALCKLGVKYNLSVLNRSNTRGDRQPLAGWYLKPEMLVSGWTETTSSVYDPNTGTTQTVNTDCMNFGADLVIGWQAVFGARFTFDLHAGMGYGVQWVNGEVSHNDDFQGSREEYSFTHLFIGSYSPLLLTSGISFGVAF